MRLVLVHILAHCGWFLLTEECTLWTVIVKQVSGNEESNVRKAQAFVALARTPCSVSHLQSNLQIYWNSYFSYAPLTIWIIWCFLPLSCMSHAFLDIKALWNRWFGNIFCQSVSCHLISLTFLSLEFDVVPLFVFAGVAFAFSVKPKISLQRLMARRLPQCFLLGV